MLISGHHAEIERWRRDERMRRTRAAAGFARRPDELESGTKEKKDHESE
jgi:tRNA G37 N-methylase TrmD